MQECLRCGTLASDKAERCPSCGLYFQQEASATGAPETLGIPAAVALNLVEYAGFWRRLGAFAVDAFILSATVQGLAVILWRIYSSATGVRRPSPELVLFAGLFETLLYWLYFAIMESSSKQATIGKQASGIIVTDYQGERISFARATGRYFAKQLSILILGIGYLMVAFTKKKQGLHDMMAGCLVVGKKVYPANLAAQIEGQPVQGTTGMTAVSVGSMINRGGIAGMLCPRCGTQNEEQARFCKNCGASLQAPAATPTPVPAITVQYAGFWRRFAAAFLDGLIVVAVSFILSRGSRGASESLSIVLGWLYYALLESSKRQATVGKMVLGIVVTDMNGNRISFSRATGRYFGKILSALILFIGFLMIAFTEKKQGLHDRLAGTLVLKK